MRLPTIIALSAGIWGHAAYAEWCEPPEAPPMTPPELAFDFREEFKDEFERYFQDAPAYIACLDRERARIREEIQFTVQRYERFLNDKRGWDDAQ